MLGTPDGQHKTMIHGYMRNAVDSAEGSIETFIAAPPVNEIKHSIIVIN